MRADLAGDVALGRLDLDHLGAHVGQQQAAIRAGQHVADLDDPDAGERSAHCSAAASFATTLVEQHVGGEHRGHAEVAQFRMVLAGDGAADEHLDAVGPPLAQFGDHVLDQFLVAAGEDAQADCVDAFVHRHLRDLRRAAPQAGVDHLGAGIAQRERDDLRADVVSVESRLADQDALACERPCRLGLVHRFTGSLNSPHSFFRQATISPTVA